MPTLTTLVSFDGADGGEAVQNLLLDASGNLFGTTEGGGSDQGGTVFEVLNTGNGYSSSPVTLASFNGADGEYPASGLTVDSTGDLFGATFSGGANGLGTIFELPNSSRGDLNATPVTLVNGYMGLGSFLGPLSIDAAGNLFGTTTDHAGLGEVFEVAKTASGYANSGTILSTFQMPPFDHLGSGVVLDAAGDLFGTANGGAYGNGTIFELVKTSSSYASTPTTLATISPFRSDSANNGTYIDAGLSIDTSGDLFGSTSFGEVFAGVAGTVFELAETPTGYASTTTTLANFNGGDGDSPAGTILIDGAGNLFGTTYTSAFEVPLTPNGYANTPTTLATFDQNADVLSATNGLTPDASGDLFGTTAGGGQVFELTNTGFVPTAAITPSTIGAPVYRFYDPSNQDHFYTSSTSEVAQIRVSNSGLVLEGPAFSSVNPATDLSAIPVYRFYDTANNSHFYTDSQQEVQSIVASQSSLILEGPAFYVDPNMQPGDTTVYRFYGAQSGTHFYTDSPNEKASILASNSSNLTLEGPAFYVKA